MLGPVAEQLGDDSAAMHDQHDHGHPQTVDSYFKITERGSTVGREVRGGIVTFFTMAYIVVLNPLILGFAPDADGNFLGGGDARPAAIAAATALVAGVMTILMGVVANYPLALATGLGLNAFVAFSIAPGHDLGGRDGSGGPRGPHHPGARADRLPPGGVPRGARPS